MPFGIRPWGNKRSYKYSEALTCIYSRFCTEPSFNLRHICDLVLHLHQVAGSRWKYDPALSPWKRLWHHRASFQDSRGVTGDFVQLLSSISLFRNPFNGLQNCQNDTLAAIWAQTTRREIKCLFYHLFLLCTFIIKVQQSLLGVNTPRTQVQQILFPLGLPSNNLESM